MGMTFLRGFSSKTGPVGAPVWSGPVFLFSEDMAFADGRCCLGGGGGGGGMGEN